MFTHAAKTRPPKAGATRVRDALILAGAQAITPFWEDVEAEVARLEEASRPKVEKRLTKRS